MRVRAKTDINQPEIVGALRKAGYQVILLHQLGGGVPDILVCGRGVNVLMEIKTEDGELTKDQVEFFASCKGLAVVVRSAEEALDAMHRATCK